MLDMYLEIAAEAMAGVVLGKEKLKQHVRDEWEKSKNYPRKMKKRVRKELLLDWSMAHYDPFGFDL